MGMQGEDACLGASSEWADINSSNLAVWAAGIQTEQWMAVVINGRS